MILEIGVSVAAVVFGLLGLGLTVICYKNFRHHRELIEFLAKQNDELEEAITAGKEQLETSAKRLSDQSRRIAWLETRVRQSKPVKERILEETVSDIQPRPNMTERRHRVLTLASRGQDSKKIAATLGMMPGEVELIINLNRVAA